MQKTIFYTLFFGLTIISTTPYDTRCGTENTEIGDIPDTPHLEAGRRKEVIDQIVQNAAKIESNQDIKMFNPLTNISPFSDILNRTIHEFKEVFSARTRQAIIEDYAQYLGYEDPDELDTQIMLERMNIPMNKANTNGRRKDEIALTKILQDEGVLDTNETLESETTATKADFDYYVNKLVQAVKQNKPQAEKKANLADRLHKAYKARKNSITSNLTLKDAPGLEEVARGTSLLFAREIARNSNDFYWGRMIDMAIRTCRHLGVPIKRATPRDRKLTPKMEKELAKFLKAPLDEQKQKLSQFLELYGKEEEIQQEQPIDTFVNLRADLKQYAEENL